MNTNQLEVIKWWHSGCDYKKGIMLFARMSPNKVMIHTFIKKHEKFGLRKLKYELSKAVGLDWKNIPKLTAIEEKPKPPAKVIKSSKVNISAKNAGKIHEAVKPQSLTVNQDTMSPVIDNKGSNDLKIEEYPRVIRRLKYEFNDLYNKRGVLHKQMRSIPDENSSKNMNERAILLQDINKLSDEMDRLYPFIKAYEQNGVIPLPDEIWPPEKEELPLTVDDLKKKKKRLQSANSKDRNLLQYQTLTKGEKDNPMTDGPKRQKLELRIKRRDMEIEEIEQRLVDLERIE